jgi:multidrug resistance efflux pump
MKKYNRLGVVLLVFTQLLLSCVKDEKVKDVSIGKVTLGTLYLEIYEEGEIEAVNSINIGAPNISWRYGNLKITNIVKDGKEVKKGDTLVVFDPSEVNKGVVDAESRLQMSYADLEKMEAQHQSDLEELNADYKVTEISQKISKIRFESAAYEADIKKKEIQLNLEKANIALQRAKEQINNRMKIQNEELKQQKLSITRDKERLREAHETLKQLYLLSPTSGIAIIDKNWSTSNKYQIGDQTWNGSQLIQLPDLGVLRANVKINEVDISKISKGLKVEIKPDAFSDSVYSGVVSSVANLAVNKDGSSKIKVFPVEININESSDKLLPGLSVSCRIIVGKEENALLLPIDALQVSADETFVYKKVGKGFEKTLVETGANNSDYIIIIKGLSENDRVALSNPFESEVKTESESKTEPKTEE